jgi:hypothetical protein
MKSLVHLKRSFFLILLYFLFTVFFYFNLFSENNRQKEKKSRLELLHSDYSRGVVKDGIPLKILEGSVHARQDTKSTFV